MVGIHQMTLFGDMRWYMAIIVHDMAARPPARIAGPIVQVMPRHPMRVIVQGSHGIESASRWGWMHVPSGDPAGHSANIINVMTCVVAVDHFPQVVRPTYVQTVLRYDGRDLDIREQIILSIGVWGTCGEMASNSLPFLNPRRSPLVGHVDNQRGPVRELYAADSPPAAARPGVAATCSRSACLMPPAGSFGGGSSPPSALSFTRRQNLRARPPPSFPS